DGKCAIDLTQTSYPSHERDINIFSAAFIIRQECLEKAAPPWGGAANAMGDERNLGLVVKAYTPPLTRCEGAPPARRPNHEACQTIINSIMQASMAKINFAAVGVPVQSESVERLPLPLVA
ncbi:MAG: hypothetical protein Q9198_008458, partial [Flavoplaca austrocitrina]